MSDCIEIEAETIACLTTVGPTTYFMPFTEEEGDNLIDRWHAGAGEGQPLHEFLGISEEAYKAFAENRDVEFQTIEDGYRISPRGEVLAYVGKPGFRIETEDAAKWFMRKRFESNSAIAALEAEMETIRANIERMKKQRAGEVKALDRRFESEIAAYAKANLPKGKKTWSCAYGSVSFTKQAAKIRSTKDGEKYRLPFAKKHAPGLIRATTVEDVPFEGIKKFIAANGITAERLYDENEPEIVRDLARVVEFVEESEKVTISTGVPK